MVSICCDHRKTLFKRNKQILHYVHRVVCLHRNEQKIELHNPNVHSVFNSESALNTLDLCIKTPTVIKM